MNLEEIKNSAVKETGEAGDAKTLERLRVKYLGRKGELTKILRTLKDSPLEERRKTGQ